MSFLLDTCTNVTRKSEYILLLPFCRLPPKSLLMLPSLEGQNSNAFECFSPGSFFHFFLWKSRETNGPLMTWLPVQSLSVASMAFSHTKTDPVTLPVLRSAPSAGVWNAPGDSADAGGPASLVRSMFHIHHRLYFHLGMDLRYSEKPLKCIFLPILYLH